MSKNTVNYNLPKLDIKVGFVLVSDLRKRIDYYLDLNVGTNKKYHKVYKNYIKSTFFPEIYPELSD